MGDNQDLTFSEFIYNARTARGWSIREAARQLKMTHSRLIELEHGVRWHTRKASRPTYETAVKLAEVYGISVEELLRLLDYPSSAQAAAKEQVLLNGFRKLSAAQQNHVLDVLAGLLDQAHA